MEGIQILRSFLHILIRTKSELFFFSLYSKVVCYIVCRARCIHIPSTPRQSDQSIYLCLFDV